MKLVRLLSVLSLLTGACAHQGPPAPEDGAAAPGTAAGGEVADSPRLAFDPEVRSGTLDNGLRYFVRRHEQPKQRAELWLAVDAGSVLEDDDQQGLAHFVEHMAFNGTKRFEKNTLIDFLERAGMDFGADLNAFTSFDETVYMLKVPTDDPKLVTMGLDILEDWSNAVAFDPTEVDKERGVVIEEWRTRRGASQRALDQQLPVFLAKSKYAERLPIGKKEILEGAPVGTLSRFYKDWYRPDNMAVIAVGDFDPAQMEAEIKKRFSGLKNPEGARPRDNVAVPLLEETRAAIFSDPEMSFPTVTLTIKGPLTPIETEADYRFKLVEDLFHGMLRARLDEIRQKPDAPIVFAFSGTSEMGRAVDAFQLFAGAKAGQVKETLTTLVTEVERVRRHGFVATELERQKAEVLRNYERSLAEKDKAEGRTYARELMRYFLEAEGMPGRQAELELVQRFLPEITLQEVNALAESWTSRRDRVVMASAAERDKQAMPGEQALLAIVDKAADLEASPYVDTTGTGELMATAPTPGSVTNKQPLAELGVSVWTLSNGAKVVVKATEFKNDEVLFRAFSPGGTGLASNATFASARYADNIVGASGVGDIDEIKLERRLAGKVADVDPYIDETEEGLRGRASPRDLETMMQLVHLSFTAPRKDPEAFAAWKGRLTEFVRNRDLNPQQVFFDKLTAFRNSNHPRRMPPTPESIAAVELDEAFEFYKTRFANAGDFTFVFVGNVDEATLEPMVSTYLASLPGTGRKEKWKDIGVRPPAGAKSFTVEKGQDPKSFVYIDFNGSTRWSAEAQDDLEILSSVLDIRLREVLREDMGGVYSPFSRGRFERRPKVRYHFTVGFGCAPENAEKLKDAVFEIVADVSRSGIGEDYLVKVREQRRRSHETDVKENRFWADELSEHYRYGTDPKAILDVEQSLARVTSANVQQAAKRFLKKQYVFGLLNPAADQANTAATPGAASAGGKP